MKHVRTAAIAGFEKTVESLGGNFSDICKLSKISPKTFDHENYDKYISLDILSELLSHAATSTNCYHIGLILGQNKKASALGILGLIVRDTPDIKSALQTLINNLHIHAQDSIIPNFYFNETEAFLSIDPTLTPNKNNHHVADLIMGCTIGLMKSLINSNFKATEVRLGARESHSLNQYTRLLNTKVKINQPHNEIVFPRELLDLKLEEIDPQYNALLKDYVNKDKDKSHYSTRVESIIRNVLADAKCNIEYVAEQFSLNKRTLNRKLALENTTFKALVNKVKKEESQKLLLNTYNTITQVALELGYAEASSFTNAFKSWFGITPKKWQQQQRS